MPDKKFKCYITRHIPQPGVDLLKPIAEIMSWDNDEAIARDKLIGDLKKFQPAALLCMLTDTIDEEVLKAAGEHLKIVATMSVGFEHIDLEACKKRNIYVTNTPFVSTEAVAETTVAILLTMARRIREANDAVKNGEWGPWKPLWLCGPTLEEATVGIFGLGRIGFAIAERVVPFKIKQLLYHDVVESPHASKVSAKFVSLDQLVKESDFVICMCPLTPETKNIFNSAMFKKMKKSAVFINTSRGGTVNEEDLFQALSAGTISMAGLDVTDPEPMLPSNKLLTLKNCMILPHIASSTMVARNKMSYMAAENVQTVCVQGTQPKHVVK